MTQQEKQILLKDLCARLSYGVIVNVPIIGGSENKKLVSIINEDDGIPCVGVYACEVRYTNGELVSYEKSTYLLCDIKPYLRSMSSMTEDEDHEFALLQVQGGIDDFKYLYACDAVNMTDWLNRHHFDYNGLIEKGLALEADEWMYKNE